MSNNNEGTKKFGHKTNNSQSAGMTSGTGSASITMVSVPQGAIETKVLPEADNQDLTKSETVQGASGNESVTGPLQDLEGGEEDNLGSDVNPNLREFGELTQLGTPYRFSDLPVDRDAYSEIRIDFPSCKEFPLYGDLQKGLKKSERVFSTAGQYFQALKLEEEGLQ